MPDNDTEDHSCRPRRMVAVGLAFLALAGFTVTAVTYKTWVWGDWGSSAPPGLLIACYIGSMFAGATIAATWTAWGPYPFLYRLPLALVWIAALVSPPRFWSDSEYMANQLVVLYGSVLLTLWVAVQIPLWIMWFAGGLGLRTTGVSAPESRIPKFQYSIRQIMAFTAIVAVVVAVAQCLVSFANFNWSQNIISFVLFGCTSFASAVVSLPLLVAIVSRRRAIIALMAWVVIAVVVTWAETKFLDAFHPWFLYDFLLISFGINAFASAWVALYGLLMRKLGYRLGRGAADPTPTALSPEQ